MTVMPRRGLYLTALTILLVVLSLLVFISVSTYRNLNRERNAAMDTARRQALTLIQAMEAGARAGMLTQASGEDAIGNLVHEIGRSAEINYLYLVNADGEVVHHTIPSLEGTRALWRPRFEWAGDVKTRMRRLPDGTPVYEVAKPFRPMGIPSPRATRIAEAEAENSGIHFHTRATVYLGMSLTAYEIARRSDLHHALVMGAIVLALGGGVVFFYLVIRSYYRLSQTLHESQNYTRQVIASMVHGVLSIDITGRVVSSNQQAAALLGVARSDMEHLDLKEIFDFEKTGIAKTLEQGISVLSHEIQFRRPGGDSLPLLLTVTPIREEAGKRGGAVVVLRDLSEIKRLEHQVQRTEKLAAIGRLAAGVAHEIRNPLSSIRGFAYLLGKNNGKMTPEKEYADVMVREIDRINHVVTDLLNFARPMEPEPASTDIIDLVEHVVALVSTDANDHRVDIVVDCDNHLVPIMVDPNQVTQALLNLILNAVNAMGRGGRIDIQIRARNAGDGVCVQVEDDGPGIPPERLEKIFDPFYTTRDNGTGLGLAIVKKIVESHDGKVLVASPPPGKQRGTRVSLVLRSMASDPANDDRPIDSSGHAGRHNPMRIS